MHLSLIVQPFLNDSMRVITPQWRLGRCQEKNKHETDSHRLTYKVGPRAADRYK